MPPKKRGRVATSKSAPPTRRSTRQTGRNGAEVPDVFQEMLAELPDEEQFSRPAKRQKRKAVPNGDSQDADTSMHTIVSPELVPSAVTEDTIGINQFRGDTPTKHATSSPAHQEQIIFDDSATDSDESIEFEDVDISGMSHAVAASSTIDRVSGPVTVSINSPPKISSRRRQITKADRLHRLAVHKWHYMCLLLHMATVNKWCNDPGVQSSLKKLVPRKLISRLHREGTQAERKLSFDNSMTVINEVWKESFKKTEPGMKRAAWKESDQIDLATEMENAPEPVDFDDFRAIAKHAMKKGGPDLGAQLFCALCRALAIDTRLVCSLQVLPFTMAASKGGAKSSDDYIDAGEQDYGSSRRRNGGGGTTSKYPVWWVEVLNPAIDQWIPICPDPDHLSFNQRMHYEPPASDQLNNMSYVIAFEENGTAKDITRRYVSAFNAKTRKTRVESTKGGEAWLNKVMLFFAKADLDARDQIEDAELNRRAALEGMPKNIQDFKDHPIYVLERHLRTTEVIMPKKECGRVKVGKEKVETVYRRENVYSCRSADGWYRRGRSVREGEEPLLRVHNRRQVQEDESDLEVAQYAEYQTELFVPPEVKHGRVPRNAFGNLDIFVPSMIPMGGVHIRHPFAVKAARALGLDYAEAVTGFKFKGRQGTAIMDGIVVAAEYLAVVAEVVSMIEEETIEDTNDARDTILERLWATMYRTLKVQQMVQEEYGDEPSRKVSFHDQVEVDDEEAGLEDADEADDDDDLTYEDADAGGGFTVEAGEATAETRAEETMQLSAMRGNRPVVLPVQIVFQRITAVLSPHKPKPAMQHEESYNDLFDDEVVDDPRNGSVTNPIGESESGGFLVEDDGKDGGIIADDETTGGGFFVDDEVESGGFVVDDEEKTPKPTILSNGTSHRSKPTQRVGHEDNFLEGGGWRRHEEREIPSGKNTGKISVHNSVSGGYSEDDSTEFVPQQASGSKDNGNGDLSSTHLRVNPFEQPTEDYLPDAAPSPDPISTPDYPGMAPLTRDGTQSRAESYDESNDEDGHKKRKQDEVDDSDTNSLPSRDPDEDSEPEWVARALSIEP